MSLVIRIHRSGTGVNGGVVHGGQLGYSSLGTLENYYALPQCKAALDTIAWAEGGQYNNMFGGHTFTGNQHPNQCIPYGNTCSTAAGRYQFLYATWRGIANRLGLSDFGPHNQDIAALALIEERGQLSRLVNGDFEGMCRGLGCAWAALPYNGRQCRPPQTERSLSSTLNYYQSALAVYGGSAGASGSSGDGGSYDPGTYDANTNTFYAGNLASVDVPIGEDSGISPAAGLLVALAAILILT